jgi:flagellar motor switch protein FliN
MNSEAANVVVQGFLKGGFDVFDALLSRSFGYEAGTSEEADPNGISGALEAAPVVMKAKILGGGGAAMLISMADAARIVALTMGEDTAKDALDDADLGTLKEIVDGVLGGGVANLSEQFGEDVETEVIELQVDAVDGADLAAYLGDGVVMTPFTYTADPDFDGKGFFLHSAALEDRVPPTIAGGDEALVSDDEMKDILSGFSPDEEVDRMGGGPMPDNIDVILGIELTATARLGKVEMPIQEILNLGPGAIIEVGHLVDEPVELLINDHLVARGDVVVVDEKFGLRITEIISQKERIENLR